LNRTIAKKAHYSGGRKKKKSFFDTECCKEVPAENFNKKKTPKEKRETARKAGEFRLKVLQRI